MIRLICLICLICLISLACTSTITELRDGKPWVITTRDLGPFELSRTEAPQLTQQEIKASYVASLIPRGGWILTGGGLLCCCALALAFYSRVPAVDRVAIAAAFVGGGAACWGIILMGIGWHFGVLLWAIVLGVIVAVVRAAKSLRSPKT